MLILKDLEGFQGSATKFAKHTVKKHDIPLSTVWHNIRMLQKLGLIDFSNDVRLTQLGVIAAQLAVDQQDKVRIHELGLKKGGNRRCQTV